MRHIFLLLSIFSGVRLAQTSVKVKMFPGAAPATGRTREGAQRRLK